MMNRIHLLLWALVLPTCTSFVNVLERRRTVQPVSSSTLSSWKSLSQRRGTHPQPHHQSQQQQQLQLFMKPMSREDEIRRKIMKLKKQGKIKEDTSSTTTTPMSTYEKRIKQKLGKNKSKLLGFSGDGDDDIDEIQAELDEDDLDDDLEEEDVDDDNNNNNDAPPQGRIGAIPELQQQRQQQQQRMDSPMPSSSSSSSSSASSKLKKSLFDPSLFQDSPKPEMAEEDLVDLVAQKLEEKRRQEAIAEAQRDEERRKEAAALAKEKLNTPVVSSSSSTTTSTTTPSKTTSGIGGSWSGGGENADATEDVYKPKSGSWGAFPRPRDISKAYGGGRRVGVGYSNEDQGASDKTKQLLKDYRVKMGIEVPSEKEHAEEINEALELGQLAMQRGVYATAVSAFEKVTPWCSTNSKVGSKVFLELAMAYEAVGRTQEAYQVYKALSTCRMEDVKFNARRLLYGLEAMEFMRDVSSEFSRSNIKNTFIDTTGLANIAQNFDDVYQTAYIDMDSNKYKRLTESVVRSNREARQILLKATGKGEVGRLKIVQALRSMARHFDEALQDELDSKIEIQPTAMMNGKPILASPTPAEQRRLNNKKTNSMDDFVLASPEQMISNLSGKWRLQLLADKKGDGVSFFNTTQAIQEFSTGGEEEDTPMTFSASGRSGLLMVEKSGNMEWDDSQRILTRVNVTPSSGGGGGGGGLSLFGGIFGGGKEYGFAGSVSRAQQIITVDSTLLITRGLPGPKVGSEESVKEHFSVWRRVVEESTT